MTQVSITRSELKQALKEALSEALDEHRDVFHEVFAEVIEDFFQSQAQRDPKLPGRPGRGEFFPVVEGEA